MSYTIHAKQNNRNNSNDDKTFEPARGFLNLSLPTQGGRTRKLAGIPLLESNPEESKMCKWLEEDPSRVKMILASLIIDYKVGTPAEGFGFDLYAVPKSVADEPQDGDLI